MGFCVACTANASQGSWLKVAKSAKRCEGVDRQQQLTLRSEAALTTNLVPLETSIGRNGTGLCIFDMQSSMMPYSVIKQTDSTPSQSRTNSTPRFINEPR